MKPYELSFQTLSALKNPPLYILKNPEQAATGSCPAPERCKPAGLIHSWSPLLMSFLLTSFPVSGYLKTSHSHADPRLGPQAWSGWKLPLWLPWLCNLMVPGDRRQAWKRGDPVQNLEHHVPLLGCSEDFITPEPWSSHSSSGKTDGSRLQLCALHGGNSNTVCSCICMTALRISCLKTKAMFLHICILQHLPH